MNKSIIKKIIIISIFMFAVLLSACGASTGASNDGHRKKVYKIGLCNYVDDASLNQIVDNIQNEFKIIGDDYGVLFEVIYDNCNADPNVLSQIVSNFISKKVDLMIGVATPVAMVMQAKTEDTDIPVVFSAVSDPVSSGLVESMEKPGANVTGTSDYLDTDSIMDLIFLLNENTKKVGLLYNVGQDSSTTPIQAAKKYLDDKGVSYVEKTGTTVDEVKLAADSLIAENVDAIFTPTDNTIMTAELSIYEKFFDAKIPHFTGADSFALNGAFLGYGVDYANLGRETSHMAADILLHDKEISTYPVKTFDNGSALINIEACEALGYDIEDIKEKYKNKCTNINTTITKEEFD